MSRGGRRSRSLAGSVAAFAFPLAAFLVSIYDPELPFQLYMKNHLQNHTNT